jgi:hypothetical protein
MKKRTRNIIIAVLIIISCITYGAYNFNEDRQSLNQIMTFSTNGDVHLTLDAMDSIGSFSNPLINLWYKDLKKKYRRRFIEMDEIILPGTENKVVHDIISIYRNYWRTELLKENNSDKTDSILYEELSGYLIENNLSEISIDSLSRNITNKKELRNVIEQLGVNCRFFYLNGFQDFLIWDKQREEDYLIELPYDTLSISVVFIENYILRGHADFATFGYAQIGGWTSLTDSKLFCNEGEYDITSEQFKVSYLKHEANHFLDKKNYPNLSSTDLEYRSKLIELIYCETTIYDKVQEFIHGASSENRNYSHPYANYCIIRDLSKILFDSDFEKDITIWKSATAEEINKAAKETLMKRNAQINMNSTKII